MAVRFGTDNLTYGNMQRLSLQVAHYLKDKGIGPGNLVALICGRSEHMITGMLGILKAGAAYVPVDADLPDERIGYILEDSASGIILTTRSVFQARPEIFEAYEGRVFFLDEISPEAGLPDIIVGNAPDDPAYVIYTSGSTGKPKGWWWCSRASLISCWAIKAGLKRPLARRTVSGTGQYLF